MEHVSKDQFDGMRFNPFKLKKPTYLLQEYKDLQRVKSFTEYSDSDRGNLILYIVLMYSSDSPLRELIPNLEERKKQAMKLAELKSDMPCFGMIITMNSEFVSMIIDYAKTFNGRLSLLVDANEEVFYQNIGKILDPIAAAQDAKDAKRELDSYTVREKIIDITHKVHERLDQYMKELYNGDTELIEKIGSKRPTRPETLKLKS